jgi:hypothetical protein
MTLIILGRAARECAVFQVFAAMSERRTAAADTGVVKCVSTVTEEAQRRIRFRLGLMALAAGRDPIRVV